MNKKGFTLVELLAVIVILAIILVIAIPKVIDVINGARLNSFNLSSKLLENATEKYVFNENISVPLNTTIKINYSDIKTADYISTIVDPNSKNECINSKVKVTNNEGKYEYDSDLVCDNYIDLEDFNKFKNYNFSSGTTDWSGVDATIAVNSNVLVNTGNGGNNLPVLSQYTNMDSLINHKIYLYAKARLTNSDYTQMSFILSSSSWNWEEVAFNYNSRTNVWYDISTITTISANYSGYVRFMLSHGYSTSAIANGKIMELDGNVGVYLIDLTDAYGAGNEPTKSQMDKIIDNMT